MFFEVEGPRDWSKSGNLAGSGGVAGKQADEAATIGFACSVDSSRIDAVARKQMGD